MKFDHIDGTRLKQAIIAGARRVIMMQDNLNRINVFPVADNDTGTNMALTMQCVAEGVISCQDVRLSVMSQCLAESALMGARGNSGAILAQFFQGLSESFTGKGTASLYHFGEAVGVAKVRAFEAITEPKEGTILTVMHDWAESISHHCHQSGSFMELLRKGLSAAQHSLKETPKKMKILAKAGVVDAGAQGFVHMLEGMFHFFESGKIEKAVGIGGNSVARARVKSAPEDITFRFCTECLIAGVAIERIKLRDELRNHGNSLIVAGSAEKVRVHIHTDHPETVFEIAGNYGEVSKKKFDDMRTQHQQAYGEKADAKIALITDSSCDLPPEFVIRHNIQMVPVQISFGKDTYLDKINITPKEYYRLLQESEHYPKTSQPTPGDYLDTYNDLWGHYEEAISIHLSGALSGTFQAAETAASSVSGHKISLVDSCTTCVALGLIVAEAAHAIGEGLDSDAVLKRVEEAKKNVRFFVYFENLEYAIRGGRLSKSRGLLASVLNLKPILTLDKNGNVEILSKTFGGKAALRKIMQFVIDEARGKRKVSFGVAHANAPQKAAWLEEQIKKQFELNDVMVVKVSPALGAHAGPGAAGVAFLGE